MKKLVILFIFIDYFNFLHAQNEEVFVTEPEVNYDLYDEMCDILRDSIIVFFVDQKYVPKDYESGVKIFFTVKKNGDIIDVEFEEDSENEFNNELTRFLKSFKFNDPLINYFKGDAFNVRMGITLMRTKTKYLNIGIEHYNYWEDENYANELMNTYCKFSPVDIKKIKPKYSIDEDKIVFNVINNQHKPIYYYITIEKKRKGWREWKEVPVIGRNESQIIEIEGDKTFSDTFSIKDLHEIGEHYFRVVVNYGFTLSSIDCKKYSYSFDVKSPLSD